MVRTPATRTRLNAESLAVDAPEVIEPTAIPTCAAEDPGGVAGDRDRVQSPCRSTGARQLTPRALAAPDPEVAEGGIVVVLPAVEHELTIGRSEALVEAALAWTPTVVGDAGPTTPLQVVRSGVVESAQEGEAVADP